jgi:DNA-binding NtrC family response regulator
MKPLQHLGDSARESRLQIFEGEVAAPPALAGTLIAQSAVMRRLTDEARRFSGSKVAVLIEGESGTGKELIARLIHEASPRSKKPFVRVNCAALSEHLVESELFGHERGAFTGAEQLRIGRFERADGGTLLLDEIGEMPSHLQAKLLRALEEEEIERVGGTRTVSVDVRIVATTNRDLDRECAQRNFRSDLLYRLGGVRLHLPPLRQRPEEIPSLVEHFIARFGPENPTPVTSASPRTIELLRAYSWPGNVRQLRNAVHRACLVARKPRLEPEDLPPLADPTTSHATREPRTLEEIERRVILETLRELGGNKTAAAERLGVTARTLLNKLKKYGQSPGS